MMLVSFLDEITNINTRWACSCPTPHAEPGYCIDLPECQVKLPPIICDGRTTSNVVVCILKLKFHLESMGHPTVAVCLHLFYWCCSSSPRVSCQLWGYSNILPKSPLTTSCHFLEETRGLTTYWMQCMSCSSYIHKKWPVSPNYWNPSY